MQFMRPNIIAAHRQKGAGADMQRDRHARNTALLKRLQQGFSEMQAGGGCGDSAGATGENCLVIVGIIGRWAFGAGDIGRQRDLPGLFQSSRQPRLIRAEIKPRGASFRIIQDARGAILSAFNLQFIPGLEPTRIADQRVPNASFLMPVQHDFNPRLAAPGMEPRGDDARVIHHHDIAGAKQARQITHATIFQAIRAHHQHARGIARANGRLRDQMFRQDEIIIIQPQRRGLSQHPGAVARSRRGRNRPGPTRPAARPEATAKRGISSRPLVPASSTGQAHPAKPKSGSATARFGAEANRGNTKNDRKL